jgi:hypothetical protein
MLMEVPSLGYFHDEPPMDDEEGGAWSIDVKYQGYTWQWV